MRALIAASLRLRLPVVALSIILMVVGIKAASDAPLVAELFACKKGMVVRSERNVPLTRTSTFGTM